MMNVLTKQQINFFQFNGYLLLENAVDDNALNLLRTEFQGWVDESRQQNENYGECIDGRARFDLEATHSAVAPALRRVNAPIEISETYNSVMRNSRMSQAVSDLIGPDVKFHHSKVNSKLPGSNTNVKWHQDFLFTPHSNDDLVTALLMLDDVTEDNGPLEILPQSHKGPLHSLWHNNQFTGAVEESVAKESQANAVQCCGTAGTVCLMHTRLLHASAPNQTSRSRTLFICVYSAADAIPCSPNPMPNKFEGDIVSGQDTNKVRAVAYSIRLPEVSNTASFFNQQDKDA
jgi:ectoine hydroxylase-related dioxygenase (phytanoyl-CoA dioxygenase family)